MSGLLSRSLNATLTFSALLLITIAAPSHAQLTVVSGGYTVPETISHAPSTFGTYGGGYFIPYANGGTAVTASIDYFDPSSGDVNAQTFVTTLGFNPLGGLFLPTDTYWGDLGGDFLAAGQLCQGGGGVRL